MARTAGKQKMNTLELVQCAVFVALIIIGAFIKIMLPIGPFSVTFSLQFLFALMAGLVMGAKRGALIVLVYLIIGLSGIPVFAHGGGPGYLIRPTFGFLIGFMAAAFVAGLVVEKGKQHSFKRSLIAAVLGEVVYYLCGLVYYYLMFNLLVSSAGEHIGIKELISVWCFSTFLPDLCLAVFAVLLAERLRTLIISAGDAGKERNV